MARLCPSCFQSNYPNDAVVCVVDTVCVVVTTLSGDISGNWGLPALQWEDSLFSPEISLFTITFLDLGTYAWKKMQRWHWILETGLFPVFTIQINQLDFWTYACHWELFSVVFKLLFRYTHLSVLRTWWDSPTMALMLLSHSLFVVNLSESPTLPCLWTLRYTHLYLADC